jgi:hypothetical protein
MRGPAEPVRSGLGGEDRESQSPAPVPAVDCIPLRQRNSSAGQAQLPFLWDQPSKPERSALLVHARAYWEILRNRMPPLVHDQLEYDEQDD